jgi:hypothetical protein
VHSGLAACAGLAIVMSAGPVEARRLALIIGNGQYANTDQLANPERDVDAVSARLKALQFEVAESKDVSGDNLRSQITSFKRLVADGDTVIIYYAGHGMEVGGRDYLLPVNADIQNVGDVPDWGYPLDGLFFTDKRNVSVIVIFDACRDNTFLRRTRSNTVGTSVINVPPGDMVIFSAGSGEVALDGDPGAAQSADAQNSVFATALLTALAAPNLDDRDLFVEVRRQVQAHSNQTQNPQIIGALNAKFVFNAEAGAGPAPTDYAAAQPQPAAAPSPAPVEMAAETPAPGASVYRSVPAPNAFARPAPSPVEALSPPASAAAPAPAAAPVTVASAQPAPPVNPATAPPGSASTAMVVPAAAPPPAPAEAPPVAPMQVASLGRPASAASAGGYGSSVVETAVPKQPGVFTVASLGVNKMPARPELTPVPTVNVPASFCSAQERNIFHDGTYKPAWQIASNNNDLAIKYLDALNALHREYAEMQSGYVNMITREYNDYAPIAAQAFETSNRYTNLHDAIMAAPISSCR